MAPISEKTGDEEELEGSVEGIIYSSEEDGFVVARFLPDGKENPIRVVGKMLGLKAGENLKISGSWVRHPKYGMNFNVTKFSIEVPTTLSGIKNYLSSGLIDGIGEKYAERIVEKFKENTFEIIEKTPEKLLKVQGIGKERLKKIISAWDSQKGIRNLIMFLKDVDISTNMAAKIYKTYDQDSISVLKSNPYKLTDDIFGIGFKTADRIAGKLGIDKDSPMRIEAGIEYILKSAAEDGHCFLPELDLIRQSDEILNVNQILIPKALENLLAVKKIVIESNMQGSRNIYLNSLYNAEVIVSNNFKSILKFPPITIREDTKEIISKAEKSIGVVLENKQREAIQTLFEKKVVIVTGGPGTGKTTLIRSLVKVAEQLGLNTLLAAPTGRAAKRLSESSNHIAKTIHRLLEFNPITGRFMRDQTNTLEADLVVLDEVSMIDIQLMANFIKAVKKKAFLLFIGDINQLPSVGPGNVLKDMLASKVITFIELTHIFRQAQDSLIVTNAHMINNGFYKPLEHKSKETLSDFYFIQENDPPKVLELIKEMIVDRIPRRFKLNPIHELQVLTPMNKGEIGASNLNKELQFLLNKSEIIFEKGLRLFKLGDKVMQIRNNYKKNIFNGDIGFIASIDNDSNQLIVKFDEHSTATYEYDELDEITLAYATTIHKAQGSEYPAVIVPILTQHFMLLQRNLLYTAVTRAKKLVILIGDRKAVYIALNNNKVSERYTLLTKRLRAMPAI
jgi:exodeoxyribonuclease V alpha subunit